MRYPYDIDGFYTWNPIDTDDVIPNTTSVNPEGVLKPKIDNPSDPDSGWIMGYTPEEVEIYLADVKTIRDGYLAETNTQATASLKDRIPMTETEINSRKDAETFYRTEVLRAVPGFDFPDKNKIPCIEWTHRQTITIAGTSVIMDYFIDAESLREVSIEGQPIYAYVWDFETQTLSGVNVGIGDHLKIKY